MCKHHKKYTKNQDIFNGYLDIKHVTIYFTGTFDIPVYYHNFSNFFLVLDKM